MSSPSLTEVNVLTFALTAFLVPDRYLGAENGVKVGEIAVGNASGGVLYLVT
jgi:hypothetical protein